MSLRSAALGDVCSPCYCVRRSFDDYDVSVSFDGAEWTDVVSGAARTCFTSSHGTKNCKETSAYAEITLPAIRVAYVHRPSALYKHIPFPSRRAHCRKLLLRSNLCTVVHCSLRPPPLTRTIKYHVQSDQTNI